ncbi:MAG: MFS transporter [Burkholderiaceae bacterium]|jgi:MFS family permease|nr:MFS transporter [Burkholderiaceae bacterium]
MNPRPDSRGGLQAALNVPLPGRGAAAALRQRARSAKKTLLMIAIALVVGVEFLENGMFVFASSHIIGGIDSAPREFATVLAAYATGSMLMIGMQQWLSRHFGYRNYLIGALTLFLIGALASAAAENLTGLIIARAVQGFGGGALFTSARVLIPTLFSVPERSRAIRFFMFGVFGAGACAPALSAALIDGPGWRWIFLAVVPLVLLAITGIWFLLPDRVGRGQAPVQWAAAPLLLFAAAITLLQLALSQARYDIFGHPEHLAITVILGTVLFLWFLRHQWNHREPMFKLRELAHPAYLMGLALYFMHYCLTNVSNYVLPIYAESGLGIPVTRVGWLNTFAATVSLVVAYAYVRLSPRMPRKKPLMVVGVLALALATWGFSSMPADAPARALLPMLAAKGIFGVLLVLPVAGMTFRELGDERFVHAYQSKNLMRQISISTATALAAIVLQNRQFANHAELSSRIGSTTQGDVWLHGLQSGFTAAGLAPPQAHGAALAEIARVVNQQALLLACEDLYRMLTLFAVLTIGVVLFQRRFK